MKHHNVIGKVEVVTCAKDVPFLISAHRVHIERKQWSKYVIKTVDGLLLKHRDVFAINVFELGRCNIGDHNIEVGNKEPIKERYRRIPP